MDKQSFMIKAFSDTYKMIAMVDTDKAKIEFFCTDDASIKTDSPFDMPDFISEYIRTKNIHKDDICLFDELTDICSLRRRCEKRESGKLFSFRRKQENSTVLSELSLYVPKDYSDERPYALICRKELITCNEDSHGNEKDDDLLKVRTFGNFVVFDRNNEPIRFKRNKSRQLVAYLVDKYGYPTSTADMITDILEKPADDLNAVKYISALMRSAVADLKEAGYENIIIKEWNSMRINVEKLDCDYYHLCDGDTEYTRRYNKEYMKEYSWAEETNADIMRLLGLI